MRIPSGTCYRARISMIDRSDVRRDGGRWKVRKARPSPTTKRTLKQTLVSMNFVVYSSEFSTQQEGRGLLLGRSFIRHFCDLCVFATVPQHTIQTLTTNRTHKQS